MEELWVPVLGYEGLYEISNLGALKSLKKSGTNCEKIVQPTVSTKGVSTYLNIHQTTKFYWIHDIVIRSFYNISQDGLVIFHLDGDITNNVLANLSYELIDFDSSKEQWKSVPNYSRYLISSEGRVWNIAKHRLMQVRKNNFDDYWGVAVVNDSGEAKGRPTHRLVAEAFIPNPEDKPQVNHIDGNKANNCASNLEWCTGPENVRHAYTNGLIRDKSPEGIANIAAAARLTLKQHCNIPIVCENTGMEFESMHHAALYYNVDDTTIQGIVRGETKKIKETSWINI